jgi:hypothetical protein
LTIQKRFKTCSGGSADLGANGCSTSAYSCRSKARATSPVVNFPAW